MLSACMKYLCVDALKLLHTLLFRDMKHTLNINNNIMFAFGYKYSAGNFGNFIFHRGIDMI